MPASVTLAEYLFARLRQHGVESIHGVPGDYNLTLLDYVEPALHWVGNCNELNAGYAADAYARIKGLGALITTFGVGELSASNAIAGAYAELAPVVHIVGTPARRVQDSNAKIHHTLNDGNFQRFAQMHAHITIAQASLRDAMEAPYLIDSIIQQCLTHSRPVYIEFPADMVSVAVPGDRLKQRIEMPPPGALKNEIPALTLVMDRIRGSKRPMILVDGETHAYGITDGVEKLVRLTNWPTWTTVFGKSYVDETLPNVHGVCKGNAASKEEKEFFKSRDLVLCFGPHFSSTNTYNFSSIPDLSVSILFKSTAVQVSEQIFQDIPIKGFLAAMLTGLELSPPEACTPFKLVDKEARETNNVSQGGLITQAGFYKAVEKIFRPGDVILAETGTAGHGCRDFKLPSKTRLFKPSTWLSIGYMLPATQGAALAQRELHTEGEWPSEGHPRAILLIGDGSFQMTVQELSTIIREKLNVVIFLINNDGYTIERCLHGYKQRYNDVAMWRYQQAPAFFGGNDSEDKSYPSHTFTVKTWQDLYAVLDDKKAMDGPGLSFIEVMMDKEDAPPFLKSLLDSQKPVSAD